jgi:putative FmdB family regulatory protein
VPLYDYVCAACGRRFEVIHGVHGDPPTSCPLCGSGPVRKAISAPSVHYKGSGWAKKERRSAAAARSGSDSARDDTGAADTGSGDAGSGDTGSGAAAKAGTGGSSGDGATKPSGTTSASGGSSAKTESAGGSASSKTAASGGD